MISINSASVRTKEKKMKNCKLLQSLHCSSALTAWLKFLNLIKHSWLLIWKLSRKFQIFVTLTSVRNSKKKVFYYFFIGNASNTRSNGIWFLVTTFLRKTVKISVLFLSRKQLMKSRKSYFCPCKCKYASHNSPHLCCCNSIMKLLCRIKAVTMKQTRWH